MNKFNTLILLAALIACFSCSKDSPDPLNNDGNNPPKPTVFTPETIYDKLSNPWGMTWLPDGRMLVTEKAGDILIFKDDKYTGEKLTGVPGVYNVGQGGLLDIEVHPNYGENGWIYITYAKPMGDNKASTAVARFKLDGTTVTDVEDIFVAQPALDANFHFGSRVVFDKNGYMFVSVGERGTQPLVQELNNDHGKVHRLFDDGSVPEDNPFVGQGDAHGSIWTLGHRNPQGMIYDEDNDRIWLSEHGPKGGDELNLIEKGKNYGWPKTTYGVDYDGSIISPDKELPGIENPKRYWVPSIAPCGIEIVKSDKYPDWKDNILVGALSFKHVARVQLNGSTYVTEEKLFQDIGRVRDVKESPDGYIYILTEGPGLLSKVIPSN